MKIPLFPSAEDVCLNLTNTTSAEFTTYTFGSCWAWYPVSMTYDDAMQNGLCHDPLKMHDACTQDAPTFRTDN